MLAKLNWSHVNNVINIFHSLTDIKDVNIIILQKLNRYFFASYYND